MNKIKTIYIRMGLVIISLIMVGTGIYMDEISVVLSKAVTICLECIGIG